MLEERKRTPLFAPPIVSSTGGSHCCEIRVFQSRSLSSVRRHPPVENRDVVGQAFSINKANSEFPQPFDVHPTLTPRFRFADTGLDYRERSVGRNSLGLKILPLSD
jgi:hypothetical protein